MKECEVYEREEGAGVVWNIRRVLRVSGLAVFSEARARFRRF